ncbi:MAG: DegT/DnrJ/EryC1/StrS family aminotransferase [Gemmatimonadales bacterium]
MTSLAETSIATAAPAAARVPFVDLAAQHRGLAGELVVAFAHALESGRFVGGPEVEEFEREFAAYCEAPECVGVSSGTDALRFAYVALGVRRGDEVIAPAHTFIATAEAVSQAGGTVRFTDIDARTLTLDPRAVRAAIGPRTVGIVAVHLYGQPADMDPLRELAQRHGLWLVEDCAQAHGARYKGRRVGALADAGCFSFYPSKNLGALGEGGAVTLVDGDLSAAVRRLREHGQSARYVHECEGYNGRLHALQAAFLRVKLRRLEEWNDRRRQIAAWYDAALRGVGDLRLPEAAPFDAEPVYHLYVVRTERRAALHEHLAAADIEAGLHYPCPLHLQPAYGSLGYRAGSLPETERAAAQCLSLPMFPSLADWQVARVGEAVRGFFHG